jgi:tight adherence protein B
MCAELSAGRASGDALDRAIGALDPLHQRHLAPVVATARDGGDVPAALTVAARLPGAAGLGRLAACWQVSATTGAPLGALADRVTLALRDAETHRHDIAAQLAGPRATARLLAVLPLLGILMGAGLGMHPLSFLTGGPPGLACLTAGVALDGLGVWWIRRMAARVLTDACDPHPGSGRTRSPGRDAAQARKTGRP